MDRGNSGNHWRSYRDILLGFPPFDALGGFGRLFCRRAVSSDGTPKMAGLVSVFVMMWVPGLLPPTLPPGQK